MKQLTEINCTTDHRN